MRHHTQHIALVVQYASDVACGPVDALGITQRNPTFAFQSIERRLIREIIAVMMSNRIADALARFIAAGESALCILDR